MRIVSLEPYLTETTCVLGLQESLVGISHRCDYPEDIKFLPRVTVARDLGLGEHYKGARGFLPENLSPDFIQLEELVALKPDLVLTAVPNMEEQEELLARLRSELRDHCGEETRLAAFEARNFEEILQMFQDLGRALDMRAKGWDLAQRVKSQLMDWGDNFHDRMRNKRVSLLASVRPLKLGGWWIPDMIRLCSGLSQNAASGHPARETTWEEIVEFRPDVIVVAPKDYGMSETLKVFKELEQLPGWEDVPAVKRGEVIFTDGVSHFHRPTPRLMGSMGVLVSAIAGLESGYITPRDSFYRLRWLEMQRHKI